MTGVRICRRLQRVNRALSILPSRVQHGATAFILDWDDVEMLPRHLGAFEVGYEAVKDSESLSHQHRLHDNGSGAGSAYVLGHDGFGNWPQLTKVLASDGAPGDGSVGINDLLALLANWGNPWVINDLLDLLAAWGACP